MLVDWYRCYYLKLLLAYTSTWFIRRSWCLYIYRCYGISWYGYLLLGNSYRGIAKYSGILIVAIDLLVIVFQCYTILHNPWLLSIRVLDLKVSHQKVAYCLGVLQLRTDIIKVQLHPYIQWVLQWFLWDKKVAKCHEYRCLNVWSFGFVLSLICST